MKKSNLKVADFAIVETVTAKGKKALCIVSKKRLSVEDFKALMQDIKTASGFPYLAYREGQGRCIHAVKIDAETLQSLANQYTWATPVKKEAKKETLQAVSKVTKKQAKKQAQSDAVNGGEFTPEQLAQFKAYLQAVKMGLIA